MSSAFYLNDLKATFIMNENTMKPYQTGWQSGLGPWCLQYRFPKNIKQISEQTTIAVNGKTRLNICNLNGLHLTEN